MASVRPPGRSDKPVIGLITGDPAGIGPEVVLKTVAVPEVLDICRPVVIGDGDVVRVSAARWAPGVLFVETDAREVPAGAVQVVPLSSPLVPLSQPRRLRASAPAQAATIILFNINPSS